MYKVPAAYLILLLAFVQSGFAQDDLQKCWVTFTDKSQADFTPESYFDPLALQRREALGIDPNDPINWPVNQAYAAQVNALFHTPTATLRWSNSVVGYASPTDIAQIASLAFVKDIQVMAPQPMDFMQASKVVTDDYHNEVLAGQTHSMGRLAFEADGLDGTGIRIAVLDAGFKHVDQNGVFDPMRANNQIKGVYDFVQNNEDPFNGSSHGSFVLSCIGGQIDDEPMGLATGAEYLLIRTERGNLEFKGEEENWMEGVEYADKMGAHIINSSLGYTSHRYYQYEMDGNHAGVSSYAKIASRLGILVVNAAGNEGTGFWQLVGAPADVDSVLAVGGVDPESRLKTDFSSIGPTADKRMKPDVCAYGVALGVGPKGHELVPGTSFASPLVAGFAACLWQAHPDWNNMQVFQAIRESGHLYPYYDYFHGYGIPQAHTALGKDTLVPVQEFSVEITGGYLRITLNEEEEEQDLEFKVLETEDDGVNTEQIARLGEMLLELVKETGADADSSLDQRYISPYLYVHFEHPNGVLAYHAVMPTQRDLITIDVHQYRGDTLRIYYKGYLYEQLVE